MHTNIVVSAKVYFEIDGTSVEVVISGPTPETILKLNGEPALADKAHTRASVLLNAAMVGVDTALRATPIEV